LFVATAQDRPTVLKTPQRFEELACWKAATAVRKMVGQTIRRLPQDEKHLLSKNMRRTSRSITRNIAEAYGRLPDQESVRCCIAARGALFMLMDQYIIARDEDYISPMEYHTGRIRIDAALHSLDEYIDSLPKLYTKKLIRNNCHLPLTLNF
jgi:four helix bundle protein